MVTGRVPFIAEDSAEVMRKHLKESLIPPDHINTSLSAGTSEVIEIMMAKRREDRYKNVEELLIDLEAIRNGQPPVQAHKRFDVSMLEPLSKGNTIEAKEEVYAEDALARYKVAILILSAVSAIAVLIIIILLLF
jgi:serine/threonine protein kinase